MLGTLGTLGPNVQVVLYLRVCGRVIEHCLRRDAVVLLGQLAPANGPTAALLVTEGAFGSLAALHDLVLTGYSVVLVNSVKRSECIRVVLFGYMGLMCFVCDEA